MSEDLRVNVVLELKPESVRAVVDNAKRLAGTDDKGHYRVDTAEWLGVMISAFLREKDFESFAADIRNYFGFS